MPHQARGQDIFSSMVALLRLPAHASQAAKGLADRGFIDSLMANRRRRKEDRRRRGQVLGSGQRIVELRVKVMFTCAAPVGFPLPSEFCVTWYSRYGKPSGLIAAYPDALVTICGVAPSICPVSDTVSLKLVEVCSEASAAKRRTAGLPAE
jgi:hypothetical protein